MRSKYEIQEVTVINYAEIELEWTLRDVLSNDIIESVLMYSNIKMISQRQPFLFGRIGNQ